MPDGGMIACQRSDGYPVTDNVDAVFVCNEQPTGVWFGSTIQYNSLFTGWDLQRPDGTLFHFGRQFAFASSHRPLGKRGYHISNKYHSSWLHQFGSCRLDQRDPFVQRPERHFLL